MIAPKVLQTARYLKIGQITVMVMMQS